MAGSLAQTKTYYVGPQDGWFQILDSTGSAPMFQLQIRAQPHMDQFSFYAGTTAPTTATPGNLIGKGHICVDNFTSTGSASKFYVRVTNPRADAVNGDGRLRIDVYADGGTLT